MSTCILCGVSFEARKDFGLCGTCISSEHLREYDRLGSALHKASRVGLTADLTLKQWLTILSDFSGKCSFCDEYTASIIEQVEVGRGLTYDNVVPSCRACHSRRNEGYAVAEERVREYLRIGQ